MNISDWCATGDHGNCYNEREKFYIDPRTNKPVYTGETMKCYCTKRSCPCYVPPAERVKGKTRKSRRKK